jgi:hypothetical protein
MASLSDNLLSLAEELLNVERVGDAGRRRAISTAYYATFLRLSSLCAATFSPRTERESYEAVLRALNHKDVRTALNRPEATALLGASVGKLFVELLSAREWADYSSAPHVSVDKAVRRRLLTRSEAVRFVGHAREIVAAVDALDLRGRRKLAILLVFHKR